MKSLILILATLSAGLAFAGPSASRAIKKNIEIKSFVATFEKNRNQKCGPLRVDENPSKGQGEVVDVYVTCNEYDKNGTPMANVHIIKISGRFYGHFYVLDSALVIPME